jgi:hypothetical protein
MVPPSFDCDLRFAERVEDSSVKEFVHCAAKLLALVSRKGSAKFAPFLVVLSALEASHVTTSFRPVYRSPTSILLSTR